MPFVPDPSPSSSSFVPDREGELAAEAGPRGYTYQGKVVKPADEPNLLQSTYENVLGGHAGTGAILGTMGVGKMLPPEAEEGGPAMSQLSRAAARASGAALGGATGAVLEGKNPMGPGIGAGLMEAISPIFAAPIKWGTSQAKTTFEMGKYVNKIGQKMGEIFHMDKPIKTEGDLYQMLHYDPNKSVFDSAAGDAAKRTYQTTAKAISEAVGEGAKIAGDAARGLKEILYKHSPAFKKESDNVLSKWTTSGAQENPLLNQAIRDQLFADPITLEAAMEAARDLSKAATKGGKASQANKDFRDILANWITGASKNPEVSGETYRMLNLDYKRAMDVLRSFDSAKLFGTGTTGGKFNRAAWIKAANDAEKTLKESSAEALDEIIRMGRKPGATSTTMGLGGTGHVPLIGARVHLPRKEFEVSPLRPAGEGQNIDAVLRALGANIGARTGE